MFIRLDLNRPLILLHGIPERCSPFLALIEPGKFNQGSAPVVERFMFIRLDLNALFKRLDFFPDLLRARS